MVKNIFYAHSGGVTAVLNASACGVIQAARQADMGAVYIGKNGIVGGLQEELIEASEFSDATLQALYYTPASTFGSCRYKITQTSELARLISVFSAHNIHYFLYNGGGDSQDTLNKVSEYSQQVGYPLQTIGIPKTIDNDLRFTDHCPGFGSAAKYIATSLYEATLDLRAMAHTSTKVFVVEVMGRHSGWLAAAAGLVTVGTHTPLIVFPEVSFDPKKLIDRVITTVNTQGFCTIAVSEGITIDKKLPVTLHTHRTDAFGHAQLGGVALYIANLIKGALNLKVHWAVLDYLQRSAGHSVAAYDRKEAYRLGKSAINSALKGRTHIMLTLKRLKNTPYTVTIGQVSLNKVANRERRVPNRFIDASGFGITNACKAYLAPLIEGEDYPPYHKGLPAYLTLEPPIVPQLCEPFRIESL